MKLFNFTSLVFLCSLLSLSTAFACAQLPEETAAMVINGLGQYVWMWG